MLMKLSGGGSGYCITLQEGYEVYNSKKDIPLDYEIEHQYPDYSIYNITDTAYGFMTRGCPRGCDFCIVGKKLYEGKCAHTVAPLSEFWRGQKYIKLLDPNPIAVKEWRDNLQQLIDSKSYVDFTQGVDIRLMTNEKAEYFQKIKVKNIHFAWDRYQDKNIVVPKLKAFKNITGWGRSKLTVYCLTNFDTTIDQDLERVYTLRDLGYSPYVMIYNKNNLPKTHILRKLQRYVNAPMIFNSVKSFDDYNTQAKERIETWDGLE